MPIAVLTSEHKLWVWILFTTCGIVEDYLGWTSDYTNPIKSWRNAKPMQSLQSIQTVNWIKLHEASALGWDSPNLLGTTANHIQLMAHKIPFQIFTKGQAARLQNPNVFTLRTQLTAWRFQAAQRCWKAQEAVEFCRQNLVWRRWLGVDLGGTLDFFLLQPAFGGESVGM